MYSFFKKRFSRFYIVDSGVTGRNGVIYVPVKRLRSISLKNSWTFGLAQLFTSVSPEVTEEFEVPYMKRIFEKFGDVYYGCCEKLDDRLDIVSKLPNVRKISCSPWSDPWKFAENLPDGIIMSNKPNPALIAAGNMDGMKEELKNTIAAAKAFGRPLEMILKDNSTVQYEPQRLWEFSKMALEIVNNL